MANGRQVILMSKTNCELYVVYGSDFEGYFGHKYFSNEKQALDYKELQEKIKAFDFEEYHIKPVTIEDETIDYSKIKLFSVLSVEFCNYDSVDTSLEEYLDERKTKYYIDNKENEFYKEHQINIVVGDYTKPEITIKYDICFKDESNIEDILNICKTTNKLILNRAIELSKKQLELNEYQDNSCDFIVSETLEKEFKKLIVESFSAYSFNEKEN